MERIFTKEIKNGEVVLKGWVSQIRDLGGLKFFLLRDREGIIQVTAKKDTNPELFDVISGLHREDCVEVKGTVKVSEKAPGGKEIMAKEINVINKAETPLPIETSDKIQSGFDKRFDFRFIDLRNRKVMNVFKIKQVMFSKLREFFEKNGFIEIQTPVIQAAGAEGGATLFPLIYYNKEAFLRQSPQLYKQILMASGMDRVYEIGQVFRAEKFHTRRHLSEYVSIDMEMAWIDSEDDVMKIAEGLVHYALKETKKTCKEELKELGIEMHVPELPFPRLTYDKALDMLSKEGIKIERGEDLEDAQERVLGEIMQRKGKEWYFIYKYPSRIKPFYIMMDGEVSRGMDLDYKGMEIASGGQREHRYDMVVKVMKQKGLDPHKFEFYLSAFRYGMPPHGGFGLGSERLIEQALGLDNVKETVLFPRTPERLVP
ncbi:MAG: aspartate--tRNA(Asn) ligase [Candidatus Aenigmatarchaeota archaeon]|nr:MAG: aspartate--tRNA(Asn) ligase [Candidatus Aenigmarchaeota archaeon]RLJ08553.1 MAG: aspartate--tRNA(Asn) ligase [Candidatus Aenigmarchaeota archaeon]